MKAALLFFTTLLGIIRMLLWQPWWCYNRMDLLSMLLGYSWIIVGWVYVGFSLIQPNISITQADCRCHINGNGTLSFAPSMAFTGLFVWLLRLAKIENSRLRK